MERISRWEMSHTRLLQFTAEWCQIMMPCVLKKTALARLLWDGREVIAQVAWSSEEAWNEWRQNTDVVRFLARWEEAQVRSAPVVQVLADLWAPEKVEAVA